jgi:hypothetical protein
LLLPGSPELTVKSFNAVTLIITLNQAVKREAPDIQIRVRGYFDYRYTAIYNIYPLV